MLDTVLTEFNTTTDGRKVAPNLSGVAQWPIRLSLASKALGIEHSAARLCPSTVYRNIV